MPPKKNITKPIPAKIKKEKRKLKTPTVIKFKLPSTKCLQNLDSQRKLSPPRSMVTPAQLSEAEGAKSNGILANDDDDDFENPESGRKLTLLKSTTSIQTKVTKSPKRKSDPDAQKLANAENAEIPTNLPAVKANSMPARVSKATKRKIETEAHKENPGSQSSPSTKKAKCMPTRVSKLRKKTFEAKENAVNNLTNGGIPDSQNHSPPKSKIMKPNLRRTRKSRKVGSTADNPDSQSTMCPPRTTLVPSKLVMMTKSHKRYDAKAMKVDLANEVALAQLGITPTLVQTTPPPAPPLKAEKLVRKSGRRARRRATGETGDHPTTTDATEAPIKSNSKKKEPRKLSLTKRLSMEINENTKSNATSKMKADSTSKKSTKKMKTTQSETVNSLTTTRVKRKYIRRKGKDNSITLTGHNSPSILEDKNNEAATVDTPVSQKTAGPVETRKASLASASDCFSWTKDISDSSTTTCVTVTSGDFVRIDNKLPIVKLLDHNIVLKPKPNGGNEESKKLDSDSTDETSNGNSQSSSDSNSASNSLNLGTSSVSLAKLRTSNALGNSNQSVTVQYDDISKVGYALDKIVSQLKKIDIEIINWIGPENEKPDANMKQFEEKIFKILKREHELIMHCRKTKRIFSDVDTSCLDLSNEFSSDKCPNEDNLDGIDVLDTVCDANEPERDEIMSNDSDNKVDSPADNDKAMLPPRAPENSKQDYNPLRLEQMAFDNDDDDALSLFAESFTGFDSLRAETSPLPENAPDVEGDVTDDVDDVEARVPSSVEQRVQDPVEAYIPQPISFPHQPSASRIIYLPTKIVPNSEQNAKTTTVCEKQNADSTSIYKETDNGKSVVTGNDESEPAACNMPTSYSNARPPIASNKDRVLLMEHVLPLIKPVHCQILKGVCFFNLISTCKKASCRYPHTMLHVNEIQRRLSRLNERSFMEEYMLIRTWPNLRRQYRMCFVEECQRRELTRVLIEMAIDSIKMESVSSVEDGKYKITVIETVLLHLNDKSLNEYGDLFKYNVIHKPLCLIFMETIAETQNFSRFKSVFVQLTHFVAENSMSFTLNVASQILERVCILPFEAPLANALLIIIKNTDERILSNSMMRQFEKQLSTSHSKLSMELIAYKEQVLTNRSDLPGTNWSPQVQNDAAPMGLLQLKRDMYQPSAIQTEKDKFTSPVVQSERERYTSPDTTKLDNMNKAVNEPVITRTMNLRAVPHADQSFTSNSSMSNDSGDYRPPVKAKFRTWRPKIYNNVNNVGMRYQRPMMRPPIRPMMMRPIRPHLIQRQVTYGPPSTFLRRHGPSNS